MKLRRIPMRYAATTLTGLGLLLVLGCSDETGLDKRYPVTGTVTYKGAPVAKGNINFLPVEAGKNDRAATGPIENGKFSLTTATANDGAFPGKYKVTVISTDVDLSQVKANAKGGAGHQDDTLKATAAAKDLTPAKYKMPESSDLTADVKAGTNSFTFDLKD